MFIMNYSVLMNLQKETTPSTSSILQSGALLVVVFITHTFNCI